MDELKSTINVKVNKTDKEIATYILKKQGLNMSKAINMLIKQIIIENGLPFEVKNPEPSKELLEALQEGEQIIKDIESGKRKGYHNVKELFKSLMEE